MSAVCFVHLWLDALFVRLDGVHGTKRMLIKSTGMVMFPWTNGVDPDRVPDLGLLCFAKGVSVGWGLNDVH